MKLYSFDASAIVDLWDNYPIKNKHFTPLWEWFYEKVNAEIFVISDVAIAEVRQHILYDKLIADIPKAQLFLAILENIIIHKKTISDVRSVQKFKTFLGITEDNYHAKGVGENDFFIVASAKNNDMILVTNEAVQKDTNEINNKAKFKIPAVCNLSGVKVQSINLIKLLNIDNLL